MNAAEFREQYRLSRSGRAVKRRSATPFWNRRTDYTSPLNGPRSYDSVAEARRAARLDQLHAAGRIRLWLPQVPLFVGIDEAGKAVTYVADFLVVRDNGLVRFEDVKSANGRSDTERSRAKRAAVRSRYPHIELVVVTDPEVE